MSKNDVEGYTTIKNAFERMHVIIPKNIERMLQQLYDTRYRCSS